MHLMSHDRQRKQQKQTVDLNSRQSDASVQQLLQQHLVSSICKDEGNAVTAIVDTQQQ